MVHMLVMLVAAHAATASPPSTPALVAVPAARRLEDVPNLVITYYDVSPQNIKTIKREVIPTYDARSDNLTAAERSLQSARRSDSESESPAARPVPVKLNWQLNPVFTRRTTNGVCTIVKVDAKFAATAQMPRIANEAELSAANLKEWRNLISGLESDTARKLWFVYDRKSEIERAMLDKSCDDGMKAGAAALEKLKADAASFGMPTR